MSNSDEEHLEMMLSIGGLGSYLDSHLCSETARSCKPDPSIFQFALRQAACSADEAIFVGDTPEDDIAGAKAVGMRTVLILDGVATGTRPATTAADAEGVAIRALPELLAVLA